MTPARSKVDRGTAVGWKQHVIAVAAAAVAALASTTVCDVNAVHRPVMPYVAAAVR